jgi:hypothetical protein
MSEEEEKRKPIVVEWHRKSWTDINGKFDRVKYMAYKSHNRIITALSRKKYGVILSGNFLYIKKVVGGIMVDETKARTLKAKVKLSDLKDKSLKEQLTIIENLFNNK